MLIRVPMFPLASGSPPAAPTGVNPSQNLTVAPGDSATVSFSWSGATGAASMSVSWPNNGGLLAGRYDGLPIGTSYTGTAGGTFRAPSTPGAYYTYTTTLIAVNAYGETAASNPISITVAALEN